MQIKPGLPRGVRDFSSETIYKRTFISEIISEVFKRYGFKPIETPAIENLNTLLGKYGNEGDRLIFKILNSGNYLSDLDTNSLNNIALKKLTAKISNKGLRYDLTIPFARYLVNHQNEITLPFRRYQIQPVWRADRPQKGRFREFYQCDADVIGSISLWNEVELLQIFDEVFQKLNIPTVLKINNRKILSGFIEEIGASKWFNQIIGIIDKLEKIGIDNVIEELKNTGIDAEGLKKIESFLRTSQEKDGFDKLNPLLSNSSTGLEGLNEITFITNRLKSLGLKKIKLQPDFSLARGLDYYTGTIFEVYALNSSIGSLGGGGRYDNLTGMFGLDNISGVGLSFGLDRIYLVMDEMDLFPESKNQNTKVVFMNFGEEEALYCMKIIKKLRDKKIIAELYPDKFKIKKQMHYANRQKIPFVALVGKNEMDKNLITLKNMESGIQRTMSLDEIIIELKN